MTQRHRLDLVRVDHGAIMTWTFGKHAVPVFSAGNKGHGQHFKVLQVITQSGVVLEQMMLHMQHHNMQHFMMKDLEGEA